ncbi:uncharacterized protein B0I36DRAFT_321514 [Microdochium trichocladiopsis]|uniref:Uncharacterized protein n=1 Tax=Microdochium trichocladiopsis TaxID=1682393 RepID=A0A9P8YA89_9PEZI|nr:uncharacterized protein B0I36DRAFT_321514 [Microdochium trichocladiopsis]KAH7033466.1 hypothetical protein B0I36DRAFT_321514 [Microdochium trichocladiopsis]
MVAPEHTTGRHILPGLDFEMCAHSRCLLPDIHVTAPMAYLEGFTEAGPLDVVLSPVGREPVDAVSASCYYCPMDFRVTVTRARDRIHRKVVVVLWRDLGPLGAPLPLIQTLHAVQWPTPMYAGFRQRDYGNLFGPPGSIRMMYESAEFEEVHPWRSLRTWDRSRRNGD